MIWDKKQVRLWCPVRTAERLLRAEKQYILIVYIYSPEN